MSVYKARASAAIDIERWDIALAEVLLALAESASDAELHVLKAFALYKLHDSEGCLEAAEEAIRLAPMSSGGHYWRVWGLMAFRRGFFQDRLQIERAVEALLACNRSDADSLYAAAAAALQLGDRHSGLQRAQEGLAIDPSHIGCLEMLASAQVLLDRDDEAEATLRRILADAPRSPFAHSELAAICLRAERFDEAREHAQAAASIDPDDETKRKLHDQAEKMQDPSSRLVDWALRNMR